MYVSELFTRGIYVQFIEGAVLFKASSPKITMYAIKLTVYCKCKCTLICAIKSKAQSSSLHMTDKHNHRFIYCFFFLNHAYLRYLDSFKILLADKKMGLLHFRSTLSSTNLDRFTGFHSLLFKWNFFFSHQSKDFRKKEIVWCTKY